VRAVLSLDALAVEGDEAAPACVTLTDTFPPAAPTGLQAVAGAGTISLIWDANIELDLDSYRVLRAVVSGDVLVPITASPIRETTFRDAVQAGVVYVYAVAAVDRAGNVSPLSNRVEETAR
jgi:fibronectin type 3 domain-containing protein